MQRNKEHIQLQTPVHIFALLRFLRFLKGMRLELSCPMFLSAGWMEEKLLVFHPSPEVLSGAGGTQREKWKVTITPTVLGERG